MLLTGGKGGAVDPAGVIATTQTRIIIRISYPDYCVKGNFICLL